MKIRNQIIEIISEHLGVPEDQIEPDHDLEKDLNAGPLELSDLFLRLEDKFKIKLEKNLLKKIVTIEDLVNHVAETLGEFEPSSHE